MNDEASLTPVSHSWRKSVAGQKEHPCHSGNLSLPQGFAPVRQRFGNVDASDRVRTVEIGKRAGNLQRPVETARR